MTTAEFQKWLNAHGAALTVDGKFGPATRAAAIETFCNSSAPAVKRPDLIVLAARLGCSVRQILAVAKVESAGGGWDDTGLLKCLYERHYLWRRVKVAVPFLSDPKPGGYTIDADHDGINDSWEKVADAAGRFGADFAFECASWGKFQIMGAHWKALGHPSVLEFVWGLSRDEAAHYEAFCRYIETNGLTGALRAVNGNPENCRAIAKGYNGGGYERFAYHQKIAVAYKGLPE
jgi:hypothetical protein